MKKYQYGDCIPASFKLYNRLKAQGKHPKIVEGWVEVSEFPDLSPDVEFLKLYYPDDVKKLKNKLYDDYIRVFQHTWVTCDNEIIDPTRNQFDEYGGILVYYEKGRYYFKGKQKVLPIDAEIGAGEIWEDTLFIHYPDEKK